MNYIDKMNHLASKKEAFIFILPYDQTEESIVLPLNQTWSNGIYIKVGEYQNYTSRSKEKMPGQNIFKNIMAESYEEYETRYKKLHTEFIKGNTFLTNLTVKTEVETDYSLEDIFFASEARYKLYIKNKLVVFSPETFIIVNDRHICVYPMKGTINTNIPNAESTLLNDEKEFSEHITVVDLLRNDIGMVADGVEVPRFRYIVPVRRSTDTLLQTVSEIKGVVRPEYRDKPGDLISKIIPAGSICGAPKKKTLEIIENIENYKRGYYSGVAGIWDNGNIESFVLIRYIEKDSDKLYFKSGGGITVYSDPKKEYDEMLEKIYVPVY